jgi:alkanesulfonate monooxygenase SsuD/methylene tetrahydromethanopterin reductase-like flavin-dependent oxidoreductase (luciferase family)
MKVGVLLPHFGRHSSRALAVDSTVRIESWGFDSVWVRDHLSFQPHAFEERATRFMEPFTTLTAVAALTRRLALGTAVTVPFRHPLVVSQLLGGVADIAGADRVIAGIGAGEPRSPFAATGVEYATRFERVREFAEVLRVSFGDEAVSYAGRHYAFDAVRIDPSAGAATPIWYGGSSRASVRRAVAYCDGWIPARCPRSVLVRRLAELREESARAGRSITVALMPLVSVRRRAGDVSPAISTESLLEEARSRQSWEGPFETARDIEGMLITGTPDECLDQFRELEQLGVEHLVLDLRLRHADYLDQLELIASEILPALRATREVGACAS